MGRQERVPHLERFAGVRRAGPTGKKRSVLGGLFLVGNL